MLQARRDLDNHRKLAATLQRRAASRIRVLDAVLSTRGLCAGTGRAAYFTTRPNTAIRVTVKADLELIFKVYRSMWVDQ